MNHRMGRAVVALGMLAGLSGPLSAQDNPADRLDALADFKVEHVLRANPQVHGSWINLGRDDKGRLLLCGQRNQPVTRLTMKDGKIEKSTTERFMGTHPPVMRSHPFYAAVDGVDDAVVAGLRGQRPRPQNKAA